MQYYGVRGWQMYVPGTWLPGGRMVHTPYRNATTKDEALKVRLLRRRCLGSSKLHRYRPKCWSHPSSTHVAALVAGALKPISPLDV